MELGLYRKYLKENYTIGRFYIDSMFICCTLEPPVRDLNDYNHDGDFDDEGEGKVYGNTAIPAGRYKVKMTWWPKHQKFVPEVCDVPGFTGIFIHSGATVKDTMACILPGENSEKGKVLNSPYWSAFISNAVQEAINNNDPVFLTIKQ